MSILLLSCCDVMLSVIVISSVNFIQCSPLDWYFSFRWRWYFRHWNMKMVTSCFSLFPWISDVHWIYCTPFVPICIILIFFSFSKRGCHFSVFCKSYSHKNIMAYLRPQVLAHCCFWWPSSALLACAKSLPLHLKLYAQFLNLFVILHPSAWEIYTPW